MTILNNQIAEFKHIVEVWRAVGVTTATKQGAARLAFAIAGECDDLTQAAKWREIGDACKENNINFVVEAANKC